MADIAARILDEHHRQLTNVPQAGPASRGLPNAQILVGEQRPSGLVIERSKMASHLEASNAIGVPRRPGQMRSRPPRRPRNRSDRRKPDVGVRIGQQRRAFGRAHLARAEFPKGVQHADTHTRDRVVNRSTQGIDCPPVADRGQSPRGRKPARVTLLAQPTDRQVDDSRIAEGVQRARDIGNDQSVGAQQPRAQPPHCVRCAKLGKPCDGRPRHVGTWIVQRLDQLGM